MKALFFLFFALLLISCGTQTSGEPDLQAIRDRLDRNACRIVREDLVFQMVDLEYTNDTTYTEIPSLLLPDSVTACPVTQELWEFVISDGDRSVRCRSGHGETEF